MKITALIAELERIRAREGDLEVRVPSAWELARRAQPVKSAQTNGGKREGYVYLAPDETPERGKR